ncbi:MAG: hypothetical protein E6J91_21735 [Deltaproteobacteria bacterium]|nr:MAG: hypothetical protein E6J91_21735 [Deltaproteobacteria bacterium]
MEALRERFGKYHVLEKIAQGGMAEVYKVKTVGIAGFEKIQALKRILPHQGREPRFIRSFIDEARIAVELTHRNIVQVFDFGKADGELFLAMELIEGKDLRTAMTQAVSREALPGPAIAAYIISEVASGLDYAHRKADGSRGRRSRRRSSAGGCAASRATCRRSRRSARPRRRRPTCSRSASSRGSCSPACRCTAAPICARCSTPCAAPIRRGSTRSPPMSRPRSSTGSPPR